MHFKHKLHGQGLIQVMHKSQLKKGSATDSSLLQNKQEGMKHTQKVVPHMYPRPRPTVPRPRPTVQILAQKDLLIYSKLSPSSHHKKQKKSMNGQIHQTNAIE